MRYNWKYPSSNAMQLDFGVAREFTRPVEQGGWGANSFMLWVDSNPVNNNNSEYMQWLDGLVDIAQENNAYVILAWHADEGLQRHPERISSRGFDAMAALAARYRDVPNVLYATQAEPGFWTSSTSRWLELRDQQEQMIDRIRAENPRALIGVSGTSWSQTVHWVLDDPVRRDNIFIKPHIYGSLSTLLSREVEAIAERWPVVIGEFGTGGRMDNGDSRDIMRYADEHLSGWQAWNLSDEGCPCMLTSHSNVTPSSYGQVVKTELERTVSRGATNPPSNPNPPADPEPVEVPLRINAGGGQFEDAGGNTWLADQPWGFGTSWGFVPRAGSSGAANHNAEVAGTPDHGLFSTERWGMEAYHILVEDGVYDVRLLFAETFSGITGPGERVFDVQVEGVDAVSGLDAYAKAGFATALVKQVREVEVTDGQLDITFGWGVENPMIKGIELLPAGSLPEPEEPVEPENPPEPENPNVVSLPFRVNAGGNSDFQDGEGNTWLADQQWEEELAWGYVPGPDRHGRADHNLDVAGTDDDGLFSTERWGVAAYHINLPDGEYDLRLLFAETWSGISGEGQRVFDVSIEGNKVIEGLDAYAEAGFGTALVKELRNVQVTGGRLDISFDWGVEEPMIKGIEVLEGGSLPEPAPDPAVYAAELQAWSDADSSEWEAFVRITVHNEVAEAVAGAFVTVHWEADGSAHDATCTTGFSGRCTVASGAIPGDYQTATAEVTGIIAGDRPFDAAKGTVITSIDQ